MATLNATQSLADALSAAHRQDLERAGDPLVDRLATALALVPAAEPADFDDGDDDLDLPMLVQPGRPATPVPLPTPVPRRRERRAGLIGFGLGLVLLVPIGIVLSTRLPEHFTGTTDVSALMPSLLPTATVSDDNGIRTTRRPTQVIPAVATASEAAADSPSVRPPESRNITAAATLPPPVVTPDPPAPAAKPDQLAIAANFIASGDIVAARDAIIAADLESNPLAVFAFAETFDPNMLAAWGVRSAHADADRARQLYQRALDNGVMRARQRLEALE